MNYPTNPALCNTCVVTCNKSVVIKRAKELVTLLMTYLIWRKMFQMMSLVYVAGYANGLLQLFSSIISESKVTQNNFLIKTWNIWMCTVNFTIL